LTIFLLFLGVLFFLIIIRTPIPFSLGIASVVLLLTSTIKGLPFNVVAQRMYGGVDSFPLLAIPLFLLAGNLMERGGMSERIVILAQALLGRIKGGLNMVCIASCMFFAGISGSAVADSAAVGGVMLPVMNKNGYDKDFSAAVLATAGTIGPIIPPSVPMVMFGVVSGVSIGKMFLGGVLPGILIGLGLMIVAYFVGVKRGYKSGQKISFKDAIKALKDCALTIVAPLIIIVGIIGGFFTPTEAASVAVVYSFIVGKFIYKDLKWSALPKIVCDAMLSSAAVMFIVSSSNLSAWLIAIEQLPKLIAGILSNLTNDATMILIILNIFILFWGMIMDLTPSIMILTPIFLPILKQFGIDPAYFGVVMVVNLCIGLVTPPVGTVLYVVSEMAEVKPLELVKAAIPFLCSMVIVLFLMILFPKIVTFIPSLIM